MPKYLLSKGLRRWGHDLFIDTDINFLVVGQIINSLTNGVYIGGTESCEDRIVIGYLRSKCIFYMPVKYIKVDLRSGEQFLQSYKVNPEI